MATDMQAIINRFKTGTANMMDYGYGTPGATSTSAASFSPLNLSGARTVTPFPATSSNTPPMYGRPPSAYDVPASLAAMPPITGTTQMPTGGSAYTYGQIPYTAGDPSRLAPAPGTSLPFINKPPIDITVQGGGTQTASIPMPQNRPNLNIQPFSNQGNVMDPGNAGYTDPMSAYTPPAAPAPQNPAVAAATTAGQGQAPQTSWVQDLITGLGTLGGGAKAEKPQTPQQAYDAANFMAANAARNQDRSGFGTDGYVRDYFGNVIGRDAKYKGMNSDEMYNAISGRPQDDSWKTIGSSGSDKDQWETLGFSSNAAMKRALSDFSAQSGLTGKEAANAFYDANRGRKGSSITSQAATPIAAGPMQAPRATTTPKRPKLPAARSYR